MEVSPEAMTRPSSYPPEPLREHRVLSLGLSRIDAFTGGFAASEVTLVDSSSRYVFDLTSLLCVSAVAAFDEEVIFIDGGNSIDPYGIANLCRRRGVARRYTLSQINVARAFTAYQLVSLINDRLEDMVRRSRASTLVVSCFVDLFFDKDMAWAESFQLIKRCVNTLMRLTREHNLVTVLTNYGLAKLHFRRHLRNLMYNAPDRLVRIEERNRHLKVIAPRTGAAIQFYPVPTYQMLLDEFFMGDRYGANSAHVQDVS